jgi:lipoprotein-anchoring transpeptidase ErfK/SrfK
VKPFTIQFIFPILLQRAQRWFIDDASLPVIDLLSVPMHRSVLSAFVINASLLLPASAEPLSLTPDQYVNQPSAFARQVAANQPSLGGGFIQFIFGGVGTQPAAAPAMVQTTSGYLGRDPDYGYAVPDSITPVTTVPAETAQEEMDPRYLKQRVSYSGSQKPGTIVIDTRERYLYLVEDGGTALRYGVGVGRPGFAWAGIKEVTMKRAWPDWRPPDEMLKRRPDLPSFMAGGPENPLGARALYLGSSLYRIHGSNEPWTIGTEVSSGCIRMRNEDVIDLYERVKVGAKVVVI